MSRRYLTRDVLKSPEWLAFSKRFGILQDGDGTVNLDIHLHLNSFLKLTRHYNVVYNDAQPIILQTRHQTMNDREYKVLAIFGYDPLTNEIIAIIGLENAINAVRELRKQRIIAVPLFDYPKEAGIHEN